MSISLRQIKEKLPPILFGLGLAMLAMGYGYMVGARHVFPYGLLKEAKSAGVEFWNWAELYLPFKKPYDHPHVILWPRSETEDRISHPDPDASTFVTAYRPGGFAFLLLGGDGEIRYTWHIPDAAIAKLRENDPWPLPAGHDAVMGAHLYANGDIVFNIQFKALVRIDRCSNVLWYLVENAHHSIYVDHEGFIWAPSRRLHEGNDPKLPRVKAPFWDDLVIKVSPEGEIVERISIMEAAYEGKYQGLVLQGEAGRPETSSDDPLHLNDIEVLSTTFASHHSFAEEGDILVSLRTIDAVAIIDKDSHSIKYAVSGNVLRQHDPDALDNGNILIFDNRTEKGQHNEARYLREPQAFGYSRVIEFDPKTQEVVWSLQGTREAPLYTSIQGAQEMLSDGNVLIVESEGGRVFEVDRETREIVWQFRNKVGETDEGDLLGRVTGAARYRIGDLPFLDTSCD